MPEDNEQPSHVENLEGGGMICRHCGGSVDAEGYAEGGDVESGEHELADDRQLPEEVSDESPQRIETERMRDFAKALGGRR